MATARALAVQYLDAAPQRTLVLGVEMNLPVPDLPPDATIEYYCPMHPDEIRDEAGNCTQCNMKLLARVRTAMSGHAHASEPEHTHDSSGIEWEEDMLGVNKTCTGLVDS
jgi:hypothetical protein